MEVKKMLDQRYDVPENLFNQTPFYARAEKIYLFYYKIFESIQLRLDDIDKKIEELNERKINNKNGSN
jgi:hypothetical protein